MNGGNEVLPTRSGARSCEKKKKKRELRQPVQLSSAREAEKIRPKHRKLKNLHY
jgi:hypothetical protein